MQDATRRGFLKATSMSAVAMGVLGALPSLAFAQEQTPGAGSNTPASMTTMPTLQTPGTSLTGGAAFTPFTVFVNGPNATDAVIYIGEREIPLTDTSIVDYLRQVAASA